MSFWTFLGFGGKPARLFAYALESGGLQAVPIGSIDAPPKHYADYLRTSLLLSEDCYVESGLEGARIIILWLNDDIGGVCFHSAADAAARADFQRLTREELAVPFEHFQDLTVDKVEIATPASLENRYNFV